MPDWLMLTREGLKRVDYDPTSKKYVERLVDDPVVYLRYECNLEKGFTLRDLCRFVMGNSELKAFISRYSQCRHIDQFHAELDQPEETDLDSLEIYWHGEVCDHGAENSFSRLAKIHGCKGEENWYGLDFCGLGEIGHLPIKLNTEFKVYGNGETARLLLSSSSEFSLLDILDALYWTISYYGGPEDRERLASEAKVFEDELLDDGEYPEDSDEELLRDDIEAD